MPIDKFLNISVVCLFVNPNCDADGQDGEKAGSYARRSPHGHRPHPCSEAWAQVGLNLPLASTETNFSGLCHSRAVLQHPLVNGFLQLKLAALLLMA